MLLLKFEFYNLLWTSYVRDPQGGVCGQRQNLDRHISQSEGQCQSDLLLGSSCFGVVEVDVIAHVG